MSAIDAPTSTRSSRGVDRHQQIDVAITLLGGAVLIGAATSITWWPLPPLAIAAIAAIAIMERFPLRLIGSGGALLIGMGTPVLVFLGLSIAPGAAFAAWFAGSALAELSTGRRPLNKAANLGIATLSGAALLTVLSIPASHRAGSPETLILVIAAGIAYFLVDWALSTLSITVATKSPVSAAIHDPHLPLAALAILGANSVGQLSAVVTQSAPWALILSAAPLAAIVISCHLYTTASADRARHRALFSASVELQAADSPNAVITTLVAQASYLVHTHRVRLDNTPPAPGEIGIRIPHQGDRWLVAGQRPTAMRYRQADKDALTVLGAVAEAALSRVHTLEKMNVLAHYDALTGLPRREVFSERLTTALAQRQHNEHIAVLFCDLDGFKKINDEYGHGIGDRVLVATANRLRATFRSGDTIARLGGDEFAALVCGADPDQLHALADRVTQRSRQPLRIRDTSGPLAITAGISIGVAFHLPPETPAELLRRADQAMYRAKSDHYSRISR
jgi:diguanylate cyclase (GGDEF)-like protein